MRILLLILTWKAPFNTAPKVAILCRYNRNYNIMGNTMVIALVCVYIYFSKIGSY